MSQSRKADVAWRCDPGVVAAGGTSPHDTPVGAAYEGAGVMITLLVMARADR